MKQSLLILIGILSICNIVFSMDWKQRVENFQSYYKKAQELESKNENEALKWYAKAANIKLPKLEEIPSKEEQRDYFNLRLVNLQITAIKKIEEAVTRLKQEGKYEEAFDVQLLYPSPSETDSKIKKLANETPLISEVIESARQLANQNTEDGYKKAYEKLNKLRILNNSKVTLLEMEIKQQEAAWKKKQEKEKPIAPKTEGEKWIFLKKIPGVEYKDSDEGWRIQNQNFEFNLNSTEAMTQESFINLIQQAKDDHLPFIFVMVQSGDHGQFIHFFDGTVMNHFIVSWDASLGLELRGKGKQHIENPLNRQAITNVEIYVIGDDGKSYLLKEHANVYYLKKFIDLKLRKYKPVLEKPGQAQEFIANLYKEEAEKGGSDADRLFQLERLWLSWAIKEFSGADAEQKKKAIERLNVIPDKPELLTSIQKTVEEERQKKQEQERLAQEAEAARKAEETRKAQEAEKLRQAEQAKLKKEQERLAQEAEAAKKEEEARKDKKSKEQLISALQKLQYMFKQLVLYIK